MNLGFIDTQMSCEARRGAFEQVINRMCQKDDLSGGRIARVGKKDSVVKKLCNKARGLDFEVRSRLMDGQVADYVLFLLSLGGASSFASKAAGLLHLTPAYKFERDLIVERTQAGLQRTGAAGKRLGRKPSLSEQTRKEILDHLSRGATVYSLAKRYDTTRQTIMRVRKQGRGLTWRRHLRPIRYPSAHDQYRAYGKRSPCPISDQRHIDGAFWVRRSKGASGVIGERKRAARHEPSSYYGSCSESRRKPPASARPYPSLRGLNEYRKKDRGHEPVKKYGQCLYVVRVSKNIQSEQRQGRPNKYIHAIRHVGWDKVVQVRDVESGYHADHYE
ncbi:hypothetical protein SAMN05421548_118125 [Paraburkholderia lycopersici]|uniref:Helix-turn-helix domain of resolvase n=1 Tax=Paraburkholderia lycopersici TaxID=416944 RepID=A0A1G6U9S6_9BURK|nr:hypothetical protein SAMN05421548_118125 [Paraburkholderia lycopersici]